MSLPCGSSHQLFPKPPLIGMFGQNPPSGDARSSRESRSSARDIPCRTRSSLKGFLSDWYVAGSKYRKLKMLRGALSMIALEDWLLNESSSFGGTEMVSSWPAANCDSTWFWSVM